MRAIVLTTFTGLAIIGLTGASVAQSAYDYPWCAILGDRSGGQSCYFTSYAQCRETLVGIGGTCFRNPGYRGPEPRGYRHPRY